MAEGFSSFAINCVKNKWKESKERINVDKKGRGEER